MDTKYSSLCKVLLLSCFAIGANTATARQLSQEEALYRAMKAMQSSTAQKAPAAKLDNIRLAYTAANPEKADQQYFYLFNTGTDKGFIIAGADDRVAPLLGYSDKGTMDADNMPPNLKWWLDEYQRQIQWMYNHPEDYSKEYKAPSRATTASIEPIVKAKWNQYAPYYNLCPMDGENRSLTGCVATAMAQIMHHHKWPKTGKGENSYNCSELGTTVSATFEGTVYDWDNMLDEYTSQWVPDGTGNYVASPLYSETAANAVATLMYHCGVACNMSYSASGSGASDWDAKNALTTYFSYDPETMCIYSPTDFSYEETCEKIIGELQADRPVYFSGQSNTGGHAFVLDGWNQEGKAHINWGWGGSYDGYFLISALDPYGKNNGYNYYQIFICGIQPPGGTAVAPYPEFYGEGNFTWFTDGNGESSFKADEGLMYNKSNSAHDFTFNLSFEDTASGNVTYMNPQGPVQLESGYGTYDMSDAFYSAGKVSDGTYKVRLVYRADDSQEWHNVRFVPYETSRQFIYAVVENGTVTYSNEAPEVEPTEATILVSDWEYAPIMNPNSLNPISFTITNTSDKLTFSQTLLVSFYQSEGKINWVFEDVPVELQPLESKRFDIVFGDGEYDKEQKNGQFELCLINEEEKLFSDRMPVTIDSEYTEKDPAFEGSQLNYNILSEEDRTCEVTYGDNYPSEVIIPEKTIIDGKEYTVTAIGRGAFDYRSANQTEVKSIYVPKTITSIDAFYTFRWYLERFEVSEENPEFSSIAGVLFNKDKSMIIVYPGSNNIDGIYTIPNSVRTIGSMAFHDAKLSNINVPESVTKIEQGAFEHSKLKSVSIHNPNLEIDRYTFRGMEFCESFDVETSDLTSKDGVLYSKDMTKLIQYPLGNGLTEYSVIEGVKTIGEMVFEFSPLKAINLPQSLERIESDAFYQCYNLTKIVIPDNVKYLDGFTNCDALTSITIGKSVELIVGTTFLNADYGGSSGPRTGLIEIISLNPIPPKYANYPTGVNGVFDVFDKADYKNVPLYVPYGCKEAYAAAEGWKQFATIIELPKEEPEASILNYNILSEEDRTCEVIRGDYEGDIIIPETTTIDGVEYTVTKIGSRAFRESKITSLFIPKSVTEISDIEVFYSCLTIAKITVDSENQFFTSADGILFNKDMTLLISCPRAKTGSYTIPSTVKILGKAAFQECKLSEIIIPEGVEILKYHSLSNLSLSPAKLYLPSTISELEDAFYISHISEFIVSENNRKYSSSEGVIFNKDKTELVYYPDGATRNSYTVPTTVTVLAPTSFMLCRLSEINLPENLEVIKEWAFSQAWNLKSVIIPDKVYCIEEEAFESCVSLSSVTLGKGLKTIGYNAFHKYWVNQKNALTDITSLAKNPPKFTSKSGGIFCEEAYAETPLYVPYGCKEAYATADGWNQFATIIELPKEDESDIFRPIDNNTCEMIGLPDDFTGELVIPATTVIDGVEYDVTAIAPEAFKDCTDITSVVIGANITTIGKDAFAGCTGITSVTIGNQTIHVGRASTNNAITIEDGAFTDCDAITTVTCWYEVPPVITDNTFSETVYRNATLIVPHAEPYAEAIGWRNFRSMTSGINGVNGEGIKIKVEGGSINIEGIADATLEVFNMSGALIYSGTDSKIDNLAAGVYIVRIGTYSTKVVVR